jgi:hypothetical protein
VFEQSGLLVTSLLMWEKHVWVAVEAPAFNDGGKTIAPG